MTTAEQHTNIITEIVLTIFRVNGSLLQNGDRLVQSFNLTSAQWQVMGAVAISGQQMTVPQIAAAMGVTRQGVQKQVKLLGKAGLITIRPNPKHQRSPFIILTESGMQTYKKVERLWAEWANKLTAGISGDDLQSTLRTLESVQKRLLKL
jgi:DNA-binding MarR family transcriptional regulator